jgi:hypothetical protein
VAVGRFLAAHGLTLTLCRAVGLEAPCCPLESSPGTAACRCGCCVTTTLARWIDASGYRSAGYRRELCPQGPPDQDKWVTELQEPIASR